MTGPGARWLLPAGVYEHLPAEAWSLEQLRRELLDLMASWGYRLVMPPIIEHLDSLSTGIGSDLDTQTFKLTDPLTGRQLGVRADMTPQVARIDAHSLRQDGPSRLCYIGTVLRAHSDDPGGSRSPVQLGAELYGHGGRESDAEVIQLMVQVLDRAGVGPVHLDLGHVGVFQRLVEAAALAPEHETALFEALRSKAVHEVRGLVDSAKIAPPVAQCLVALSDLNGGTEVLAQARVQLAPAGPQVQDAIEQLADLVAVLTERLPDLHLHLDLAELHGYRYHTGAVFAAYVPGCGQAVARGGRYDNIGRDFGRSRPATGFSAQLDALLGARSAGSSDAADDRVLAPWSAEPALNEYLDGLRAGGLRVVFELPGESGIDPTCGRQVVQTGQGWTMETIGTAPTASSGESGHEDG